MGQFIGVSMAVFLVIILLLVVILLIAKKYLSPSGKVTITINGDKKLEVEQGGSYSLPSTRMVCTCPQPVAVKAAAVSAACRFSKVAARFSTPRRDTSLERKSKTTGV